MGRSRNAKTLGEVPENKLLGRRDSVDDVVKMKKLKNEQKEFSTKTNRKLHFGNNLWKKSPISQREVRSNPSKLFVIEPGSKVFD